VRDHYLSAKIRYKRRKKFLSTWKRIQPSLSHYGERVGNSSNTR